jgi:hypothetical protein
VNEQNTASAASASTSMAALEREELTRLCRISPGTAWRYPRSDRGSDTLGVFPSTIRRVAAFCRCISTFHGEKAPEPTVLMSNLCEYEVMEHFELCRPLLSIGWAPSGTVAPDITAALFQYFWLCEWNSEQVYATLPSTRCSIKH